MNSEKNDIKVSLYSGVSKKTKTAYEAIRLQIGEWETLVFPKSNFELKYIKKYLGASSPINESDGRIPVVFED